MTKKLQNNTLSYWALAADIFQPLITSDAVASFLTDTWVVSLLKCRAVALSSNIKSPFCLQMCTWLMFAPKINIQTTNLQETQPTSFLTFSPCHTCTHTHTVQSLWQINFSLAQTQVTVLLSATLRHLSPLSLSHSVCLFDHLTNHILTSRSLISVLTDRHLEVGVCVYTYLCVNQEMTV